MGYLWSLRTPQTSPWKGCQSKSLLLRLDSAELPVAYYFKEKKQAGQMCWVATIQELQHFPQGTWQVLHNTFSKMDGVSSWVSKPISQTFATSENIRAPTTPWNIIISLLMTACISRAMGTTRNRLFHTRQVEKTLKSFSKCR